MTDRSAYVAGLRALADLLEQNPEAELPYYGRRDRAPMPVFAHTAAQVTLYTLALTGRTETITGRDGRAYRYELTGQLGGTTLRLMVYARPDVACAQTGDPGVWRTPLGERVGVDAVTETVPAGGAR